MTARAGSRVRALRPRIAALEVAGLLVLSVALRVWGLGWLPSAAGDEGNWTLLALGIAQGQPVALPPDAGFVTLLFAHLIAAAVKLLGATFFAARLPNALAGSLTVIAAYATLSHLGSRKAGLAAAAALAVHPWSVCYSRICSVPYALALLTMTLGPLLFVSGLLQRRAFRAAAGVLVTGLGAHFSPLCAISAVACLLFALAPGRRWVFRSWPIYAAVAITLAHALPVVPGALRASAAADYVAFSAMGWRLWNYVHMVGTGLAGEATLRHFTSHALPAWPASLLILPSAAVVVAAAAPSARARSLLAGFAPLYFLTAFLTFPVILGAGRDWHLPYNHSDRYLFAILPAFVLCLAELVHSGARAGLLVCLFIAWTAAGTVRIAHAFLFGHGIDRGEFVFDGGGGYRGWLVSDRPDNTLFQVRDHLLAEVGRSRAALLTADRVFIPMSFVLQGTGIAVFDIRQSSVPSGFERYFVLLWPDSVLSVGNPPTAPPRFVGGNQRLRQRAERIFRRRELVRRFVQRDGSALLELWRAEEPGPGLRSFD